MPISFQRARKVTSPPSNPKLIAVDDDISEQVNQRDLSGRIRLTEIERVPIRNIVPNKRNARKHPERQIELLAGSMQSFGFTQPIVIDEHNMILCGHGRYRAAIKLGLPDVPTIRLSDLNSTEKRALALADNKLTELAEWDLDILVQELASLEQEESFDFRMIGFETQELDRLLVSSEGEGEQSDPADRIDDHESAAASVSVNGDLWVCESHKVLCGSALEEPNFHKLMNGELAGTVFTDPPYNVPNEGHVSGRAGVREFKMARGEMSPEAFTDFLRNACLYISQYTKAGAVAFICMDWRHITELQTAASPAFGALRNLIVWVKTNAGMGSFYRSKHELIFVYVTPGGRPTNNFRLGGNGRYRTNVWQYAGFNTFGSDRDDALAMHPTVKPVAMVADALRDCSNRGDIVLDPFGGSGTTMIAAERTGRRARLIEIDPIYCDLIVKRWQTFSKSTARLAETDETFDEVQARRRTVKIVRGI